VKAARKALADKLLAMSTTVRAITDPKRPHVTMALKAGDDSVVIHIDSFLLTCIKAWTNEFLAVRCLIYGCMTINRKRFDGSRADSG
jgi:hypothetical protein